MSAGADIRQPVLAGRQPVDALWWPAGWLDEAARRRAVLEHWRDGASLYRFDDGDLLCWPSARWMDCGALGAWPLRRQHGVLCSAAVTDEEWMQIGDGVGPGRAAAWLAEGGRLRVLRFAESRRADPSEWIDVDVPLIRTFDLTLPAPEARLVVAPRDLREVLGPDVPGEIAPATLDMLEAMRRVGERRVAKDAPIHGAEGPAPSSAGGEGSGGWSTGRNVLMMFGVIAVLRIASEMRPRPGSDDGASFWFVLLFIAIVVMVLLAVLSSGADRQYRPAARARAGKTGGTGGAKTAAGGKGGTQAGGLRERLRRADFRPQAWRRWAARLSATTGLMSLIGVRNAAYMRRVMRMFDDDQLKEALRHAPPLGGDALRDLSRGPGFLLGPRQDLSLNTTPHGGTAFFGGDALLAHLRQLYRKTAERLEAQGRFDEAAYVLAVLLNEKQSALDLLERQKQFAKAAELALSWDLSPSVIVRYYALAGDWRQAVRVARRDRAFGVAVVELERNWPDIGRRLRIEWAESLAQRGEFRAAVRTIWPAADERERAAAWLATMEAAGGAETAYALIWRVQGWPQTLALQQDAVDRWIFTPGCSVERAAMAHELLTFTGLVPESRRIALRLIGPLLEDQSRLAHPLLSVEDVTRFSRLVGDAAFTADLPAIKGSSIDRTPQPLHQRNEPLAGETPEACGLAVFDTLPLPDGEWLLALGESGVVRLDAQGRRRAHLPVPADRLVGAFDGGSALLLARRRVDEWRVTRLIVPQDRVIDLGTHTFHAYSPQFDGETWTTSTDTRVRVLDVSSPMLGDVLWQVADLPGRVMAVDTREDLEQWWVAGDGARLADELWVYSLPTRRLARRDTLQPLMPAKRGIPTQRVAINDGRLIDLHAFTDGDDLSCLQPQDPTDSKRQFPVLLDEARWTIGFGGPWIATCLDGREVEELPGPARVELVCYETGRLHAHWPWRSDKPPRARHFRGTWMFFDDEGRVVALDTATCRQWRLSPAGRR